MPIRGQKRFFIITGKYTPEILDFTEVTFNGVAVFIQPLSYLRFHLSATALPQCTGKRCWSRLYSSSVRYITDNSNQINPVKSSVNGTGGNDEHLVKSFFLHAEDFFAVRIILGKSVCCRRSISNSLTRK